MSFHDRAIASFLGLALGDAFGRPLQFVRGPAVRSLPIPIAPGRFDWTDDTHMALYLAEAVLAQGPSPAGRRHLWRGSWRGVFPVAR